MDEEAQEFIDNLETRYGGKITWKTFATWYGCSDSTFREYGVFIFKINDTLYFEDFEKKYSLFGMELKTKKKNKVKYVKLERQIEIKDIKNVYKVSQANALDVIKNKKDPKSIKSINLFDKLFRKSVTAIALEDGTYHYFELLNTEDFKKNIK